MATEFDFLKQAKPASLYKLLDKLPFADAAVALAGLPAGLSVQVMAFFPEKVQGELMPAMRVARQAERADTERVAANIKHILVEIKKNRGTEIRPAASPASPASAKPAQPLASPARDAYQDRPEPRAKAKVPRPPANPNAKPAPWVPRAATSSPINGPAVPGKLPPVAGDPLESPLAKAGLLELIGRAQEKFFGKKPASPPRQPSVPKPRARQGVIPKRPEPMEGMAKRGSVSVGKTPRVIGPAPKRPPAPEETARPIDGKAIMAAILREAGQAVRANVQEDDPELFRELRHRMFYFDDLIYTEDSSLARVFTAAPVAESSLALRFAAPELRDRVFRVVSPGRAEAMRESYPARAGLDAVEEAQQKVLAVALQLQAAGRILIDPRDPDLAGD